MHEKLILCTQNILSVTNLDNEKCARFCSVHERDDTLSAPSRFYQIRAEPSHLKTSDIRAQSLGVVLVQAGKLVLVLLFQDPLGRRWTDTSSISTSVSHLRCPQQASGGRGGRGGRKKEEVKRERKRRRQRFFKIKCQGDRWSSGRETNQLGPASLLRHVY